jgi:hypothetical protein
MCSGSVERTEGGCCGSMEPTSMNSASAGILLPLLLNCDVALKLSRAIECSPYNCQHSQERPSQRGLVMWTSIIACPDWPAHPALKVIRSDVWGQQGKTVLIATSKAVLCAAINLLHRIRSARLVRLAASNAVWLTRTYRHRPPVLSLIRSHQSPIASSFAAVPSQTRPLVSMIQLTSFVPTCCTTTQSG